MKKLDEIARLIKGSRLNATKFVQQVNSGLSERATFSKIAYILRGLPLDKRTPQQVITILSGESTPTGKRPELPISWENMERPAAKEGVEVTPNASLDEAPRLLHKRRLRAIPRFTHRVKPVAELQDTPPRLGETSQEGSTHRIQTFCQQRRITTLVHFTRIENLQSILQRGLLGQNDLSRLPLGQRPAFNDLKRIDGHPDAVCLSISFPNYKLFYRFRQSSPTTRWVVLRLMAAILWELDVAFCKTNAASNVVRYTSLDTLKDFAALKEMFEDYEDVQRQDLEIPSYYTTNPQAEVLVFQPIPPSYITGIDFDSPKTADEWCSENPDICYGSGDDNDFQRVYDGDGDLYFKFRSDWEHWSA